MVGDGFSMGHWEPDERIAIDSQSQEGLDPTIRLNSSSSNTFSRKILHNNFAIVIMDRFRCENKNPSCGKGKIEP